MFSITQINGKPNQYDQKQYILTDASDVAKLPRIGIYGTQDAGNDSTVNNPCAVGSTALVCSDTAIDVYMLTPDNKWIKMQLEVADGFYNLCFIIEKN